MDKTQVFTAIAGALGKGQVLDIHVIGVEMNEHNVIPASLDKGLTQFDTVFVMAVVTSDNRGFPAAEAFARMRSRPVSRN